MYPIQQSPSKQFRQTTLGNFYTNNQGFNRDPHRAPFQKIHYNIPQVQDYPRQMIPNHKIPFQPPMQQSIPELDKYKQQNPLSRIMQNAQVFAPPVNTHFRSNLNQMLALQQYTDSYEALKGNKKETNSILSNLVSNKYQMVTQQIEDEDDDVVEIDRPDSQQIRQQNGFEEDEDDEDSTAFSLDFKKKINQNHANAALLMQKTSSQNLQKQLFAPKIDQGMNGGTQRSSSDSFSFLLNNKQQAKSSQDIIDELKLKQFREKSAAERIQQEKLKLADDDMIKISLNNSLNNKIYGGDPANLKAKRQQRLEDMVFREKKENTQNINSNNNNLNNHNTPVSTISSLVSQSQKIKALFSNMQKNNPSALQMHQGNSRQAKLGEKQGFDSKEDANESDDDSDLSGEDEGKRKKQRLNDQDSAAVKYYYDKTGERLGKQMKIRTKEEEKRAKIIQDLQQQEQAKELQKRQEERKAQRQKFIYMKEMEELRKKENEQTSVEYRKKMKETLKNMNLEEKLNELQTEVEDGEKIAKLRTSDNSMSFKFDDVEDSEEDKKNFFSLIHFIFSQDFNNPEIVRVENKKIPNKFNGWKEYFSIFEYLFLMECVSNIQQIYTSFQHHENYAQPLQCYVSLLSTKENSQGFFEFQVFRTQDKSISDSNAESGEIKNSTSGCDDDYYTLSTLHNHAVLISNCTEPELATELSHKKFSSKKNYLFFGWVVPPDHNDSKSVMKIYADIDAAAFKEAFQPGQGEQRLFVNIFKFQKMTTFLREYLAIKNMRYNGLNNFIYNPAQIVETKTPVSNPQIFIPLFEELRQRYNSSQFQSIKEICLTDKGLCMLQGPPGTGKTHTLLGLLSGLYFYIKNNPETTKPKIMICAPSNTAVDEIVSRIIDSGLQLPGERVSVNVIRIGAIDYVPSENVKKASLEYQIEKMMINKGITSNDKFQKEMLIDLQIAMVKLNQEIEKTKKELSGAELRSQLDYLYDRKRSLQSKISQQKLEKVARRDQIKAISEQLLGLADVICCTLASSISEKLERFKNQIEVLIVDEAAQCTEPNNIIPLFYEPNKMILIGDPKQLPATTFQPDSNVTKYNRSLFERIIDNNIQPYFLDQQYRMHPNIREFPSSQFYDNKLKDGDLVFNRQFPDYLQRLEKRNVQFIDIIFSRERANHKSYENECEGEAAINICLELIKEIEITRKQNPLKQEIPSVGIITPYKQQTKLINQMVRKQIPKNYHKHIQVNTIDSFQGQEKDIIIFTTVRVNTSANFRENMIGFLQDERRMNVALTRARFCLIVLGHADTLNSNPVWGSFVDFMAKNKRYGKLSKKDELRGVGELVLQGQLMVGNSSDYVKRDWGEQYQQALLKSKQVNELKLTDFEFASNNNESELNIESEEQVSNKGKEEQIEVEQEIQGNENTQEQDFDALLAGNEIESTLESGKDRSNEKNRGTNHGLIEQDKQINKKTIKNDFASSEKKEESQSASNSQHDVQVLEEQDNSESKRQRNRTGVTMKEAIENHEEEMMMKKKITGLSALVSSKSPKKPKQLLQSGADKENSNNYHSEGKENNNSNSNSIGFNCSEQQKDLMKKIFADRDSAEEENTFMDIESDRKENSQTFDIYAQMRAQKMQSLKMKKKQEDKSKHSDEKKKQASELEMKRKQEQFQEEYVKRKIKEQQEELKKKQQLAEDSSSLGMESAKGATNDMKSSKTNQQNSNSNFLRECFQLNTPPPHLASINKSQKLDQNLKGSASLSFLVSNNKQTTTNSNSAETSMNDAEKDRMKKVTVKPSVGVSAAPSAGGIYDLIKNSRTNNSMTNLQQQQQQQQQQKNIPSKIAPIMQQQYGQRDVRQQQQFSSSFSASMNFSNATTKTSTIQLLNTIYSKKN